MLSAAYKKLPKISPSSRVMHVFYTEYEQLVEDQMLLAHSEKFKRKTQNAIRQLYNLTAIRGSRDTKATGTSLQPIEMAGYQSLISIYIG
jgi:DNA repair ATPase RecN